MKQKYEPKHLRAASMFWARGRIYKRCGLATLIKPALPYSFYRERNENGTCSVVMDEETGMVRYGVATRSFRDQTCNANLTLKGRSHEKVVANKIIILMHIAKGLSL
jgi:hypothetical protein